MEIYQTNSVRMGITSRRRSTVVLVIGVFLLWAVITTTFWTKREMAIQSGDGPLLIHARSTHENVDRPILKTGGNSEVESSAVEVSAVEIELERRRQVISNICQQWRAGPRLPYESIYVNEPIRHLIYNTKTQVMYCYLPKVANTNFRRVFYGLEGVVPKEKVPKLDGYEVYFILQSKLRYLRGQRQGTQNEMLAKYKKFMVVREPLERLLSGYRNKFFHPNKDHQSEYHGKYLEFYNKHHTLKAQRTIRSNFTAGPLTFTEFLIYFVDSFQTSSYMNEHFVPAYLLCNPCEIKFDYIGKYETINRDTTFMFDKLNIDIEFPGKNDNYSSVSTAQVAEDFYKPVPGDVLKGVMNILERDYTLFGYEKPDWFKRKVEDVK